MIKKFSEITNLAVFQDFVWDNSVKDKDGNVVEFKSINILYGRNYSGKTTLSRIVRALETGSISDKYNKPKFKVEFENKKSKDQDNLKDNTNEIRVFNEDFIKDNLSFLTDTSDDGEIKSFAVLGEGNRTIQEEIDSINKLLGSNEEGKESGLYKEKIERENAFDEAEKKYNIEKQQLENKLSAKATGKREIAIKYKPELYGDQNYNTTKLKNDIQTISQNYNPLDDKQKEDYIALIKETLKKEITPIKEIQIDLQKITEEVKKLVEQKVGDSQKIEELVRDAELNRWVKEGRKYHGEKTLKICSFCGNSIDPERWALLDKHFDEESEKLEANINKLDSQLTSYENCLNLGLGIDKSGFYSKFQIELENINDEFNNEIKSKAIESINSLKSQLKQRKDNLFMPLNYEEVYDFTSDLTKLYEKYNEIKKSSDNYSIQLSSEQTEAKKQLRLNEVYRFIHEINYDDELKKISDLENAYKKKEEEKEQITADIKGKEKEISFKLSLMNDEEKGAKKVDEYLKEYFGHHYLSLSAKEDDNTPGKHYRFEILRSGEVAYNLSEGECSLIAFCYFMAKLEDVSTYDKNPIIWIDDPISSLDSNHVFFVYSLIYGKIVTNKKYQQLFISTHNLDFLKYLKRLPGVYDDGNHCVRKKNACFFIINRIDKKSNIQIMPSYLHSYITEFNYLFKQIYDCAKAENIDDTNYTIFYNFGNNARKFLELYLYYKYPDNTKEEDKRKNFFGNEIESIITGRLNNEYSHLCGVLERGEQIVEVPEMKKIAQLIISTIESKDEEQYKALLNSIEEK
jgi:wobble nucleotide-excising tRNase